MLPLFQSKATSIIYSECEFTALGLQHTMCLCHIVVCSLNGCIKIFPYPRKAPLSKTKKNIEHKMSVLIFSTTFVKNIFHSKNNRARYQQKCTSVFV